MSRRGSTDSGVPFHAAFALVAGGAAAASASSGPGLRQAVLLAAILLAVAAVGYGLRRYPADPLPWGVAAAGLMLQAVLFLAWPWYFESGLGRGGAGLADIAIAGAHLLLLAAAVIVVVRHAARDLGGVIDAALVGLCGVGPLWQWVLYPALLASGVPLAGQALLLLDALALGGVLGALAHIALTARRARISLGYLMLALLTTLAAIVLAVLGARSGWYGGHAELIVVAFLAFGTAALHPSMARVTATDGSVRRRLDRPNLAFLGVALAVFPGTHLVQAVTGQAGGSPLFGIGSLITVPLVLIRIGQLTRQRERAEQVLRHHARHDELTGLLNRRAVLDRLDAELVRLREGAAPGLAVLFCDLDRFKPVNDRLGHGAGDELLQVVAKRLVAATRDSDVVGRFGGDEFLVLCPAAGPDTAQEIAARLDAAVRRPISVAGGTVGVGISVGVAVADGAGVGSRDELLSAADARMYAHKHRPVAAGAAAPAPPA